MKEISSAGALRELLRWSKDSQPGCIYATAGTDAIFSVRQGKLEIRESDIFLETETGKALMHLRDGEGYAVAEPADLPLTLREGFPPLSGKILRVRFRNGDTCCFMAERPS